MSENDTWLMLKMYSISQRKLDLLVKILCFGGNLWKLKLSVAGELINILYIAIAYYANSILVTMIDELKDGEH